MKPSFAETRMLGDVEEILADPAIDMVIVAGSGAVRRATAAFGPIRTACTVRPSGR